MTTTWRRLFATLLMTALTALLGIGVASSASAAPAAGLTFIPAKGDDITPMYLIAPQGCPAAATNIIGIAYGAGFPPEGQPVVNNSTSGVSHSGPFVLPLQDTFNGFAAINGAKLRGAYKIELSCINRLRTKVFSTFTGTVTFAGASRFTAPEPGRALVAAVAQDQGRIQAEAGALPGTTATSPAPASSPGPSGTGVRPSASAGSTKAVDPRATAGRTAPASAAPSAAAPGAEAPDAAPAARTTKADSGGGWEIWLIVVAVAVIALGVVLRLRERHIEAQRQARRLRSAAQKNSSGSKPDGKSRDREGALTGSATKERTK